MEKRLFLAVLISIAFLWAWASLAPRLFPQLVKAKPAAAPNAREVSGTTPSSPAASATTTTSTTTTQSPATAAGSPASQHAAPAAGSLPRMAAESVAYIDVETADYTARFSNRGAELVSFRLKHYMNKDGAEVELVKARDPERTDFPFSVETADRDLSQRLSTALFRAEDRHDGSARVLTFQYSDGAVSLTKIFKLTGEYQFEFSMTMQPPSVGYRVVIGPGLRTLAADERDNQFTTTGNAVIQRDGSLKVTSREKAPRFQIVDAPIDYIGIEDNYFLTVLRQQKAAAGILRSIDFPPSAKGEKARREVYVGLNAAGGTVAGTAFFGPKQADLLDRYGLEKTLQFGTFGVIARLLLVALIWINRFTTNYGFAIIVLTVLLKVVLYPLQHKSIVSMKKMQKLQPKMNAIKDKYKKAKSDAEQRQKMNVEMMKLYQQEGISPMSGCVPILLQLPILWGFYGLLGRAIELRGAPFILWIHDLSLKDPYYITPILMTATMFIQQLITPTTVDAAQRRMFLIMPLFFGFLFKEFPSGLVIYWLVQNILTIIQQLVMNRYWKDHPAELNR
jgi:YidC/Oxa1 family membrane protein insertase